MTEIILTTIERLADEMASHGIAISIEGERGEARYLIADSPEGYQFTDNGSASIVRMFANASQSWLPEAIRGMRESISEGIEEASEDTANDMGW